VISLLSGLDILGSRRIFFNGVQDKPYELLHINGKFSRISQRSENEFIANRMHDMLCAYPDLRPCKITSKKENITNINSEKEMCRFLSKYIRDNAIGKYAIFKVYGYSDNIILIVNEFERTKITNIDDIAWVTSILYETGYLENRSIFLRNSLSVIIELKHVKGKFQEIIYAEGESGIL
jgi:hypothetical protein